MTLKTNKKFKQGLALFNKEKYFECHELLESLWKETKDIELKKFYQGIIQLAVCMHLLQEKRYAGAEKVFKRAEENLEHQNNFFFNPKEIILKVRKSLIMS